MRHFRTDLAVETKPDHSPVTEADRACERRIVEILLSEFPDYGLCGEEHGEQPGKTARRWIIDPIDGTKNYVRGVPIWATLIGIEHRGEMVAGVVSAPGLGMRWWGASAMGAFRNGTPIRASSVSALDDAQLSFAWDTEERFHAEGVGNRLLALSHQCWRTRGIGDFWQHLLVAEGAFDISIDPVVSLWDVAALVPIVDAAGARWSTLDGRHDVDGGSFLCTNGLLHDTVVKALA